MGDTKKVIKSEIKTMYKGIFEDLTSEEQRLTKSEKAEFRNWMYDTFQDATVHAFASIFIKRKINDMIRARTEEPSHHDLECIMNVCDDDCECNDEVAEVEIERDNKFKKYQLHDLKFLIDHIGLDESLEFIFNNYDISKKSIEKLMKKSH